MGDRSDIEWTEATWNPTTGCDRVSPGCGDETGGGCYALALAKRLQAMGVKGYERDGDPRTSGPGFGLAFHEDRLEVPLRWQRPRLVFVNSMSDLFHPEVPDAFIERVFAVMAEAGQHRFQILTKRPQRMATLLSGWATAGWEPAPNVWLGTSIESDRYAWRADHLRRTPAAIRFLSMEPLLGAVSSLDLASIDWLIVGGESGPRARPMDVEWARELRDLCAQRGVRFFFKQWGGRTPKAGGRLLDGRAWDEMPAAAGTVGATA